MMPNGVDCSVSFHALSNSLLALSLAYTADEAEAAESGSDTEALSWARRPGPTSRTCTRRRRRVRTSTGDASCSSQFRGVSKHRYIACTVSSKARIDCQDVKEVRKSIKQYIC